MKFRFYEPKDKVSKLNKYFGLLDDLFHVEKGYTEDEILHRIELSKGTSAPDKDYIFQTLLSYGLIAETSDLIPRYILSLPYRAFLEYLYQDSQPVNSLVIQGYISALDQCIEDLNKAYSENSNRLVHRHLIRLGKEIDNIAQTSSRNRLGVVNEVRKLKLNDEKLSYKERLAESNRLWDEYLEPLREMIAPSGSFGLIMDRLKQMLDAGDVKFISSIELKNQLLRNRAKRMQLNEQARHDLNEAQKELSPLRDKLAQESRLLEATSVIFDYLEQGQIKELPSLSLGRHLRVERQVNLFSMRSFLADLWTINTEPESIQFDNVDDEILSEPLEAEELMILLENMPDNVNIIDYFMQQHEDLTANQIFRAVSIATLHQETHSVMMTNEEREYIIDGEVWRGASHLKGKTI